MRKISLVTTVDISITILKHVFKKNEKKKKSVKQKPLRVQPDDNIWAKLDLLLEYGDSSVSSEWLFPMAVPGRRA